MLTIKNVPTKENFSVKITKDSGHLVFQATAKNSLITFKARFISLSGHSVYVNGPEDNKVFKK